MDLPAALGLPAFEPRFPWLGPDLQTLRDTLVPLRLGVDRGEALIFPLERGDRLLGLRDREHRLEESSSLPAPGRAPSGLVLLLHGLGGSSGMGGLRRLGGVLQAAGFGVLRLNLRGAGPGRGLARGTYAAACNQDLLPVLRQAAVLAAPGPLLGVGLSLGGTVLLNAALAEPELLAGLVCVSSPLDLAASSAQIERPRNKLYQSWLLRRLIRQTLTDPFGITTAERDRLLGANIPPTIRAFDEAITAPRWGYSSVEAYYRGASPLPRLLETAQLPPTLLVHAMDDPWVPAQATQLVARSRERGDRRRSCRNPEVLLTTAGGHNGFHSQGDGPGASWADKITAAWLKRLVDTGKPV